MNASGGLGSQVCCYREDTELEWVNISAHGPTTSEYKTMAEEDEYLIGRSND